MAKTVVSLHENKDHAHKAVEELKQNGFNNADIRMFSKGMTGDIEMMHHGKREDRKTIQKDTLNDHLMSIGFPKDEADMFGRHVADGHPMVIVQTSDEMAPRAVDILNKHNPIELGGRQPRERRGMEAGMERDLPRDMEGETNIPIVEEELRVGKRQVDTGGIRVHTFIQETPVEEQIRLRRETVDVKRHKVDRPATGRDLDFEEETYEFRTSAEEPVVDKQARVVEEVEIDKDIEEETHTVRDTLRRSDVEIERTGEMDLSAYDSDFRSHFTTTYSGTGTGYEDFRPYYAYGYELAQDQRYRNRSWNEVEREAQRDWRRRYPNENWDEYSEAVRTGWETGRTRR